MDDFWSPYAQSAHSSHHRGVALLSWHAIFVVASATMFVQMICNSKRNQEMKNLIVIEIITRNLHGKQMSATVSIQREENKCLYWKQAKWRMWSHKHIGECVCAATNKSYERSICARFGFRLIFICSNILPYRIVQSTPNKLFRYEKRKRETNSSLSDDYLRSSAFPRNTCSLYIGYTRNRKLFGIKFLRCWRHRWKNQTKVAQ